MKKSPKSQASSGKIILGIVFLSAIIIYAVSLIPRVTPTPININEISAGSSGVTLSIPQSINSSLNRETSLDISINTGGAQVTAAQIELSYNPSELASLSLVKGDFLSVELSPPIVNQGKITFVYAASPESGGASGAGKLATLKFTPLQDGGQINFTSNTMIAIVGSNSNAYSPTGGTTIRTSSSPLSPTSPPNDSESPLAVQSPNARTFDETGNFDYKKTAPAGSIQVLDSPPLTGFAKFIATIKKLFRSSPTKENNIN